MTTSLEPSGFAILGWGTAVPERLLTNAELSQRMNTSDEWIVERTGIRERRIASSGETTGSLAALAGRDAMKRAGLVANDVDLLIIATCTPEQPMPHTGAFVGEELGLRCGSFDINAACSGFVYALVVADAMTRCGSRNVMLIGSETMSTVVDPNDRSTAILFGDGAGAAIVARSPNYDGEILAWDLGCDGSGVDILGIRGGGSRLPTSSTTIASGAQYIHMQGQEVFKRAVRTVVDSANVTLSSANRTVDDLAWFVPHQANIRIIQSAANRLGVPMEKTLVNLDRFGNTSAASIPLALFEAFDDGRIQPGDLILISGFGAGMNWASAVVRWPSSPAVRA